MKPKVYIETSVISYLTAHPSRDLVVAAQQQITHDWWDSRRQDFNLYILQVVKSEASAGDPSAASKRLQILEDIEFLDILDEAAELADKLLSEGCLPKKTAEDALHIAIATIHRMNYLLTWNCKHIANSERRPAIESVIRENGYQPPIISTPEELIGE